MPAMDFADALLTLECPRVRLREPGDGDADALLAVYSDPRVMRHWSHAPLRTHEDIAWLLRDGEAGRRTHSHLRWAIALRADDRVIGTVSLFGFDRANREAAIGYALAFAHWGQGHAAAALRTLITFAFTQFPLQRLVADIDVRNARSRRVVERLGFHRVGLGAPGSADRGRRRGLRHVLAREAFAAHMNGDSSC